MYYTNRIEYIINTYTVTSVIAGAFFVQNRNYLILIEYKRLPQGLNVNMEKRSKHKYIHKNCNN